MSSSFSFEDDLQGWTSIGNVTGGAAPTVHNGTESGPIINVGATQGADVAKLVTGTSSTDEQVEAFLGLDDAALTALLSGGQEAWVGSAMKKTLTLDAGAAFSFDWYFDADDYLPYNDFAFFSVTGPDGHLALLSSVAALGNYGNSGWETYSFEIEVAGSYTFAFGVMDTNDAQRPSILLIDNVTMTDAPPPNTPPEGTDGTITAAEDTPYVFTVADFGFNDADESDTLLSVVIVTLPTGGTLSNDGNVLIAGESVNVTDIENGLLVFTPDADANGNEYTSFTFQVQDSNSELSASTNTLTINVDAVNDAPAIEFGPDHVTNEDTQLAIADVVISDPDAGDDLFVSLHVGYGSLEVPLVYEVTMVDEDGSDGTLSFTGSLTAINLTLAELIYTPTANYSGGDTLTIAVNDGEATPNLIVNPGAEDGPSVDDFDTAATPQGWEAILSNPTAVQYAAGGPSDLNTADSAAIGGGDDYFAGGPSEDAELSQLIDVSAYAADIDAGLMTANFSGYFGGYSVQTDTMSMTVRFASSTEDTLGSLQSIGGVTADDRGGVSELLYREGLAAVPVGTRYIEVTLVADRTAGGYNDAYADNLSLTLTKNVTSTLQIDVQAVNDAPVVDLNGEETETSVTLGYTEDDGPVAVAPSATVTDVDSEFFDGGSLIVSFGLSGQDEDELTVQDIGPITTAPGLNEFDEETIIASYNGDAFAEIYGGKNGNDLQIFFFGEILRAESYHIQDLIQAISYQNTSQAPSTETRSLTFTLKDPDGTAFGGNDTGTATATINVTDDGMLPIYGTEDPDPDLNGTPYSDEIYGLGGDDTIRGFASDDFIDGGAGDHDMVAYEHDADYDGGIYGVYVDLTEGFAYDGFGNTDTLVNIEDARGTEFNDTLIGDANPNLLEGLGGGDALWGLAGNDDIQGGDGYDEVRYERDADFGGYGGVIVNLSEETYSVTATDQETADNFGVALDTEINVAGGTARDGFGDTDTLSGIESVFGTNSNDVLIGDGENNSFFALMGSDYVDGGDGFDTVNYNAWYGEGNEPLVGVSINISDELYNETFETFSGPLIVNVAANTAIDPYGDTDRVFSIEGVGGTDFADIMIGNDANNYFIGGAGGDFFDGQGGFDTVEYNWTFGTERDEGIVANLTDDELTIPEEYQYLFGAETLGAGVVRTGYYADESPVYDLLRSIERINGSNFDDLIIGGDGNNDLIGNGGDDILIGGLGFNYFEGGAGTDTYIGGEDYPNNTDVISFQNETGPYGVVVNLSADAIDQEQINANILAFHAETPVEDQPPLADFGTLAGNSAIDTYGHLESLFSIEEANGSRFGDILIGNEVDNFFAGLDGSDYYDGGEGSDTVVFVWEGGDYGVYVNLITGIGTDSFGNAETFVSIENVRGTNEADTIIGNDSDNRFMGFAGDDTLAGGGGRDTVRYDRDVDQGGDFGVIVNLSDDDYELTVTEATADNYGEVADTIITVEAGHARDGFGDTDTLSGFENIRGTAADDVLIGNDENNRFEGLAGDDTLIGNGGDRDRVNYRAEQSEGGGYGVIVNLSDQDYEVTVTEATAENFGEDPDTIITVLAGHARDSFGDTDTLQSIEAVTGTSFNDVLIGGDERNDFEALEGDDLQFGQGGDDFFNGGSGEDSIDGGSEYDVIGFNGAVSSEGMGITVTLTAADGGEPLGAGTITGTIDQGTVDTTFVNIERVEGTAGNDIFLAGPGVLNTEDSDRTWFQGIGDVRLFSVTGNAGDDTFTDTSDTAEDTPRGLLLVNYDAEKFAHGDFDGETDVWGDDLGEDGVIVNISADEHSGVAAGRALDTFGGTDTISGVYAFQLTDADDVFYGNDLGNSVWAQGGDDQLFGGSGYDNFQGGDGDDTLSGGGGRDDLDAGAGDDDVNGGAGDDYMRGGTGDDDQVDGGDDYDVIGFSGTLDGGEGGINVVLTAAVDGAPVGAGTITGMIAEGTVNTTFVNIERVEGTEGDDTFTAGVGVVNTENADGTFWDSPRGDGRAFTFVGAAGADTFTDNSGTVGGVAMVNYDAEKFTQGDYGDEWGDDEGEDGVIVNLSDTTQQGVESNRAIDTYGDIDIINGIKAFRLTDADDQFWANDTGIYADGRAGNDTFVGGAGNDQFEGGDGEDELIGNGGADILHGGDGLDSMSGGAGEDYFADVSADAYAETLTGGEDSDTYFVDWDSEWIPGPSVADTIADFETGPGGDVIDVFRFLQLAGLDSEDNPFTLGYLRLVQDEENTDDTLLQFDADGEGLESDWTTVLILAGTAVEDFTADNFGPGTYFESNDPPVVQTSVGNATYLENAVPNPIDAALTLTDEDSGTLVGATVSISAGFVVGQDVLSFTDQNGITGVYDNTTGVLTLTGTASVADYQTALRSVAYSNTSEDPTIATRTVSFQVSDGTDQSEVATRFLAVTAQNDAPTAPATNSVEIDEDFASEATGIGASDVDSSALTYSVKAGSGPAKGVVTFDQEAGTFVYTPNTNQNGSDSFTIVISDGDSEDAEQVVTVTIAPVNDSPDAVNDILVPTGPSTFGMVYDDGFGSALAYIQAEGGGASEDGPATISAMTLLGNDTDPERTVSFDIDGNYVFSGDTLSLYSVAPFSTYGASLTLNEAGTQILYNPDVSVTLQNLLPGQSVVDTFTYTITDGHGAYDTATVTLILNGMNEKPVNTGVPSPVAFNNLNAPILITGTTVSDADTASLTTTLSVLHGKLSLSSLAGVTITNNNTNTVTLSGPIASLNAVLLTLSYLALDYVGSDTLTISTTDDLGLPDVDTVAITVAPGVTITDGVGTLVGSAGPDNITGNSAANEIAGRGGADILNGGPGTAIDKLWGEAGDDVLTTGAGDDLAIGGDGNDTLWLGADNDTGWGDDGNDTIYGEGGNDTLMGGAGDDTIIGGDGADIVYGEDGDDTIWLDNLDNTPGGAPGNDQAWGGAGNDTIHGGGGSDTIAGGDGNDTLYGDDGNDFLFGDAGNDTFYGGTGNDQFTGGAGRDVLNFGFQFNADGLPGTADDILDVDIGWGGADGDIFVFRPGNGRDIVKDYGVETPTSHDLLVFLGFSSSAITLQQMVGPNGISGTQVSIGPTGPYSAVVFLEGTPANTLTPDDFSFLIPTV